MCSSLDRQRCPGSARVSRQRRFSSGSGRSRARPPIPCRVGTRPDRWGRLGRTPIENRRLEPGRRAAASLPLTAWDCRSTRNRGSSSSMKCAGRSRVSPAAGFRQSEGRSRWAVADADEPSGTIHPAFAIRYALTPVLMPDRAPYRRAESPTRLPRMSARSPEFLVHVPEVLTDCAFSDGQRPSHSVVRPAGRHQGQDLRLSMGQRRGGPGHSFVLVRWWME